MTRCSIVFLACAATLCVVTVTAEGSIQSNRPTPSSESNSLSTCVGDSSKLSASECAAVQQVFSEWNMTQYGCNMRDPCNCQPPGKMGPCAVYCDADANGTGFVQGISFTAINPPLTGVISEAIEGLSRLSIIFLDANELTGPIPMAFTRMPNLISINLLANRLNGSIPTGLHVTDIFDVGCNALTGKVPAMDFETLASNHGCDLHDDPTWCTKYFGPRPTNNFLCPLPPGAAQYCNAKCS